MCWQPQLSQHPRHRDSSSAAIHLCCWEYLDGSVASLELHSGLCHNFKHVDCPCRLLDTTLFHCCQLVVELSVISQLAGTLSVSFIGAAKHYQWSQPASPGCQWVPSAVRQLAAVSGSSVRIWAATAFSNNPPG